MNSVPRPDPVRLSLPLAQRIDHVCDQFEAAWRKARTTGQPPRIEDYLSATRESDRSSLLRELILLEVHHRRHVGEDPRPEEYRARFSTLDRDWLTTALRAEAVPRSDPSPTGPSQPEMPGEPTGPYIPIEGDQNQPRFFGNYELLEKIGQGGMGVVYKARQRGLKRVVALKMILSGSDAGPQELARFRREAEALGHLSHPNIVPIYDVGEHEGRAYFSLEYIEGGSLARRLDATPWPARRAAALVETLARAVHVAHKAGLVHRDLKPANILLTADATPKITDFGLAKRVDGDSGLTASNAIMGTPSYMAPEQAKGKTKDVGPAADIYALGATLYELLTGRPPFKAETPLDTIAQVHGEDPAPPRSLYSKVPRDLEAICLKCLEKEPRRRYASALALAIDLRRFLDGEAVRARRVRFWHPAFKWAGRNRMLAILIVAAILGSCLGIVAPRRSPLDGDYRPPQPVQQIKPTTKSPNAKWESSRRAYDPSTHGRSP